ncbi:LacI family DNA-binding transcriptional regulator [Rathayibacter sp. VKM Ac-2805]|uniref:LacI family DNA-binding transcriptional regulator n=1 Tax=Rathayibacter sp. VKM Ac-2805 TaxID=2609258 RepID=UPI00131F5404|nr:LacI family DNA-binding transcriptional regulator [Rathayibacter sp. VKM Ac-2805]QHC72658.1 substrate-binding domain-containing protein [Rathayibacter sp. VKM Ac-2805]
MGEVKLPTMADVAERAGVALKTVSRVVNGETYVSDAVREKVQFAIGELGYRPNRAAQSLMRKRSGVMGIVAYGSPLYGPSMSLLGLAEAVKRRGLMPSLITTEANDHAEIQNAIGRLIDMGVDGVLIAEPVVDMDFEGANHGSTPIVVVGGRALQTSPTAGTSIRSGAHQAVEHLLQLGHQTVHHLAGAPNWYATQARIDAWREVLEQSGRDIPAIVAGDWTPASGYEAARALLAEKPTAVFVANDHMAIGLLKACHELGVRVPEDLSIVGFDDVPEATYLTVPLTTVRVDMTRNMADAVDELLRRIDGDDASVSIAPQINAELMVRETTARPRPSAPASTSDAQ